MWSPVHSVNMMRVPVLKECEHDAGARTYMMRVHVHRVNVMWVPVHRVNVMWVPVHTE